MDLEAIKKEKLEGELKSLRAMLEARQAEVRLLRRRRAPCAPAHTLRAAEGSCYLRSPQKG